MHEYRVVENDGKIAVINDKAYTEVYRKTIGGKDCRMAITVDKKDPSWGTDYTVQNTNKWYGNEREVLRAPMGKDGKWKTKKAKFFFKTNADTHVLTIGRSRKGRDESINSIYFFYGQESTPYFRRKIIRLYICRTIQMAYVYLHSGLGNKKSQCRAQRRRFGHTEDAGAEKKGLNHWIQTLFLSAARSVFPSYCVRHLVATANGCRSIYS